MSICIQEQDFDVGSELSRLCKAQPAIGAVVSFVGLVRDHSGGQVVSAMELTCYPGMTEKALQAIEDEARRRWSLLAVRIIHRVGQLLPCDQIVLVMVGSAHRGDAFAAGEFIMDHLKTRAPFWKKEQTPAGSRWVEARIDDDLVAARWGEAES